MEKYEVKKYKIYKCNKCGIKIFKKHSDLSNKCMNIIYGKDVFKLCTGSLVPTSITGIISSNIFKFISKIKQWKK